MLFESLLHLNFNLKFMKFILTFVTFYKFQIKISPKMK